MKSLIFLSLLMDKFGSALLTVSDTNLARCCVVSWLSAVSLNVVCRSMNGCQCPLCSWMVPSPWLSVETVSRKGLLIKDDSVEFMKPLTIFAYILYVSIGNCTTTRCAIVSVLTIFCTVI